MSNATSEHGILLDLTGEQTPRLTIQHLNGDITIEGWDRPALAIRADDADENEDLAELLNVVQQGNDVRVNLDFSGLSGRLEGKLHGDDFGKGLESLRRIARHFGRGVHLDMRIAVPYNCDITVRAVNGDIDLRRVQGKLYVENTNGDMNLDEVRGNILLKSAAGDIEVKRLQGRLGVRTASGDVTVRDSDLSALSVGTASGDVEVRAVLRAADDYDVQTVSGDVQLAIPNDTRARVRIETVSGDIECALPHRVEKHGRRQQVLEINGGGETNVHVRTVSGDIEISGWGEGRGAAPAVGDAAGEAAPDGEGPAPTRRFSSSEMQEAGAALGGDEHFRAATNEAFNTADVGGRTQRLGDRPEEHSAPHKSAEMTILEAIESGDMSVDDGLRRLHELAH